MTEFATFKEQISGSPLDDPHETRDLKDIVNTIQGELCEPWLPGRVQRWVLPNETNGQLSFIGTITTRINGNLHYITCRGNRQDTICGGTWSRQQRHTTGPGLHCVFGGWVNYEGKKISEVLPDPITGQGRSLKRLRRLWAEHVVSQVDVSSEDSALITDYETLDGLTEILAEGLGKRTSTTDETISAQQKDMGKGGGGWDGMSKDGSVVLKRDSGRNKICNNQDRCNAELGGYFASGDIEVWMAWHGLSALTTRDGRWRPGYHLENLICLWTSVIDYALTRELWRDMEIPWMQAMRWALQAVPLDVPQGLIQAMRDDVAEMMPTEKLRMRRKLKESYIPEVASSAEQRHRLMLDRAAGTFVHHLIGEPVKSHRSLLAYWVPTVANDIIDYERDVLCGETNNCLRSLSSEQQVVDGAGFILEALSWMLREEDFELLVMTVGVITWYMVYWRYNMPKITGHYPAVSVRNHKVGRPQELDDLFLIMQSRSAGVSEADRRYGLLYDLCSRSIHELFGDCTCHTFPKGHNACKLLSQAFRDGGNDNVEQELQTALLELSLGTDEGDLRCECGLDLLFEEAFVRFFNPEEGIVARMHYRTGLEMANTQTE